MCPPEQRPHPAPQICGVRVDAQGRCQHYHSDVDVVAHLCTTCKSWWACYCCHQECADHPFGTVSADAPNTVLCGACHSAMDYGRYSQANACPVCGHGFNPGCAAHRNLYVHS